MTSIFCLDHLTRRRMLEGRIAGNEQLTKRMECQDSAVDQRTGRDTPCKVAIGNQSVASGRASRGVSGVSGPSRLRSVLEARNEENAHLAVRGAYCLRIKQWPGKLALLHAPHALRHRVLLTFDIPRATYGCAEILGSILGPLDGRGLPAFSGLSLWGGRHPLPTKFQGSLAPQAVIPNVNMKTTRWKTILLRFAPKSYFAKLFTLLALMIVWREVIFPALLPTLYSRYAHWLGFP